MAAAGFMRLSQCQQPLLGPLSLLPLQVPLLAGPYNLDCQDVHLHVHWQDWLDNWRVARMPRQPGLGGELGAPKEEAADPCGLCP